MRMVLIEELQEGMELAQDVYDNPDSISPVSRSGIILNTYIINRLREKGIRSVYIRELNNKDPDDPASSVRGRPSPVLDNQLREDAITSLKDMFEIAGDKNSDVFETKKVIQRIDTIVDALIESLFSEDDALVNINDLKSYDDYTYHHSLSVAVLSLAIGQHLCFNSTDLKRLGVCAMMHDIGKTAIPVDIIRKPSRLSDQEFQLIKTHSTAGYEYLFQSAIGDEEIWRAVLHHHEKLDGSGYPLGLKSGDIPPWSNIISVADVYDALTSNRPYRKPMQPSEAIEYIMGGIGSMFDFNVVSALVKKIDLYPIGCRVMLSNGQVAEVLNNEIQQRPIVRVVETDKIMDLFRDRQYLNIVVSDIALK